MSAESATLAGRVLAESLMTATCIARRATGETALDPTTDADVPVYADLFSSVCKIQSSGLQARGQEVGGRTATTVVVRLDLPVAQPRLEVDDVVEILTSAHDSQLVGRKFTIVAPFAKEFATVRRYEVEEVVA